MRDPARIDRMLDRLRAAWLTNPDARLVLATVTKFLDE